MANITWGSAVAGNWSAGANWVGGVKPAANDVAIFDGTGVGNCTVDEVTNALNELKIAAAYTGVFAMAATAYVQLNAHTLSQALDLRPGTYYLLGDLTTGTVNLTDTTASASARVVIKTSGAFGIRVSNTGTCVLSYVDFTSKNDNSLGATIAGSSGIPAAADQTVGYVIRTGTATTAITLTDWTAWYCDLVASGTIIGYSAAANAATMTLTNGKMRYCSINESVASYACLIGSCSLAGTSGAITIVNIDIDTTCSINDPSWGLAVFAMNMNAAVSISNSSIRHTGNGFAGILVKSGATGLTHTITNCLIVGGVPGWGGIQWGLVGVYNTAAITATLNVSRCTITNTGTGTGIMGYRTGGTLNLGVINSIIKDCDGASGVGLNTNGVVTVTHTNNVYYNNTTDCFEALHATEITGTDPQLGNLPAGCVIDTALCPFPDGHAVGNLALEFTGSDTRTALGIPADGTQTGWKYSQDKLNTPGAYYILTTFPEVITGLTPNSGTTAGGTAVAWAGLGFGATQGTGKVYLDGVEQTVTAWADDGPDITTIAHAAGLVDASCTNYRGATFSLAGAFTYVSPAPPVVGDDLEDLLGTTTLWEIGFDWKSNPVRKIDMSRTLLELSTSRITVLEISDYLAQEVRYSVTQMDASEINDLVTFFSGRLGRYRRFWLPVVTRKFTIEADATEYATQLIVSDSGFAEFCQGYERIIIYLSDGARVTRGISAATDNGDGTETLDLITPLYRNVSASDVLLCCPLIMARFTQDELALSHITAHVAEAAVGFRELVREYVSEGGS